MRFAGDAGMVRPGLFRWHVAGIGRYIRQSLRKDYGWFQRRCLPYALFDRYARYYSQQRRVGAEFCNADGLYTRGPIRTSNEKPEYRIPRVEHLFSASGIFITRLNPKFI